MEADLSSVCATEEIVQTPPKRNLCYIQYQLAVWQTNPPFRVQLTFGAGVAWSSCLNSRLPRVTRCHRYNPAVSRTSCALANYGASDLCPKLTNTIGSPLSPGQTCCHRVKPAVTRFPSTCAMLPWRTSYDIGTATMLAGV
ncbi:hypothetical protein PIB30_051691 [Stylosanthes scabra]|uniref:Uncharacterized protein n=1 Tax=Stylosanthes scabra TaxID=79078 RepID=A0ABU6WGH7_9FABA|nr:hypothetical protein [Stylosanthes scabra]